MNWERISYFTEAEFKCRHCGYVHMQQDFVARLDILRQRLGSPLRVMSGYRCPQYNDEISFTGEEGPHTKGVAADIAVAGPIAREVLRIASDMRFNGIGIMQKGKHESRYIHLDDVPGPFRLWTY